MRSLRSLFPAAVLGLALVAALTPPAIAGPVHGRGPHAEAAFYAGILDQGHARIQILDELCANPARERRCTPIRPALERAVTRAVDRPIVWVDTAERGRGVYWVLGPVRFQSGTAKLRWAWRDLRPFGCFGGGSLSYQRERGAWRLVLGIEYEGCSASRGSG
jgi:hypothetical protein